MVLMRALLSGTGAETVAQVCVDSGKRVGSQIKQGARPAPRTRTSSCARPISDDSRRRAVLQDNIFVGAAGEVAHLGIDGHGSTFSNLRQMGSGRIAHRDSDHVTARGVSPAAQVQAKT